MHQGNRIGRRNTLAGDRHGAVRPRRAAGGRAARGAGAGPDGPRPGSAGPSSASLEGVEARLASLRRQARELAVHIDSLTHAYEQAADETVTGHLEYLIQLKSQRLDELSSEAAELERTLSAAGAPELPYAAAAGAWEAAGDWSGETRYPGGPQDPEHPGDAGAGNGAPAPHVLPDPVDDPETPSGTAGAPGRAERTEELVSHGRRTSYPRLSRRKTAIAAAIAAAFVAILVTVLATGGASWPDSVATVRSEADKACQNPNLESEPDQVNFACAKDTRQVLWVFALLTSDDNPNFADAKTHRLGLEPIQPAEGGEIAWSLNLHHPYNPDNPIDSLAVAARAINNIIGGATVTGTNGSAVVQPGLESDPANCLRYTGSAAVTSHGGFPSLCARPVASLAGQAALVADVYKQWIVGASPQAAQDAAILYQNSNNPGDPRVQAILKQLQSPDLRA